MSKDTYFSVHDYYGVESPSDHIIPVPIEMGEDTLPEELEMLLHIVSKGDFVSYKDLPIIELMISLLLDKLNVYYQLYPDEAKIAAGKMIRILQEIETDDDVFPSNQIAAIQSIVHIT